MPAAQDTEAPWHQRLLELLRHSGCIYCLDLPHGTPRTGGAGFFQNCPGSRCCTGQVMPILVPWNCQLEPPRPKTATQTHSSPSSPVPVKLHRMGRAAWHTQSWAQMEQPGGTDLPGAPTGYRDPALKCRGLEQSISLFKLPWVRGDLPPHGSAPAISSCCCCFH